MYPSLFSVRDVCRKKEGVNEVIEISIISDTQHTFQNRLAHIRAGAKFHLLKSEVRKILARCWDRQSIPWSLCSLTRISFVRREMFGHPALCLAKRSHGATQPSVLRQQVAESIPRSKRAYPLLDPETPTSHH